MIKNKYELTFWYTDGFAETKEYEIEDYNNLCRDLGYKLLLDDLSVIDEIELCEITVEYCIENDCVVEYDTTACTTLKRIKLWLKECII